MISLITLIISLSLIMYLAYKGYSTIITAPIVGLLTLLISLGFNSHLMANYTEVYMSGFANFIKSYFPLFLTGAIFAKLIDEVGYGKSIASFITTKLGKDKAILAIVLSGALLTYGGVSLFVVTFILYPLANILFKEADIPKRLIPGTIALGAFTFTMTAMPGSPEIQNVIPMSYFGTDTFAAPLIGLIASIIMFSLGMLWLIRRSKKARNNGEGYGSHTDTSKIYSNENLPSIFVSIIPILIIFITNFTLSKFYFPNTDGSYLTQYGITLDEASGTWSVIIAITLSIIYIILLNYKKLKSLNNTLSEGVKNSFLPLLNSSAIVGYGTIIKVLPIFTSIQTTIMNISSNPIISESISVNIICGLTASASGGLGITLSALAPTFIEMSEKLSISPEILHRIASLSSGGLDTLPHNGAVITTLAICGLTHKESYKDIFVTSVVIPIFTTAIIVAIVSLNLAF